MKKLFQYDPLIEIHNLQQFKFIGKYNFIEASLTHCKFQYEHFSIMIKGKKVHIDVLKEEELILHVEELETIEMHRKVRES